MHLVTTILPLLIGASATIAEPPFGLRVGVDHGYGGSRGGGGSGSGSNTGSPAPPDPAFPFTDLCTDWRLEYLVAGGELSLWTQCAGATSQSSVISLLALDSSLVASKHGIKPAYPSNTAPASFSSTCRDCTLPNDDSVMACNCTANQGAALLTVDLAEWITAEQGVPCFTDGVVCGTVQSSSTTSPDGGQGQEKPSSTTTKDPKCTE